MLFFILIGRHSISGKQLCDKEILMCVIIVKLLIVNMTVMVDYIPAVMFWDLQEGQGRFYDFDGVADGYCQFTHPLGPWQ